MSEVKTKYLAVEPYEAIIDIDGEKYAVPSYDELAEMVYRLRNQVNQLFRKDDEMITELMVRAKEERIAELERDCFDSQNHNTGVIDRIIQQLRDAGYTGTLSEMVDAVIHDSEVVRNWRHPSEGE